MSPKLSDFKSFHGPCMVSLRGCYLRQRHGKASEVRTTAGGYKRYTFSDSSEVWLRPNGEVVRLPQREYDSQGQRTNKGMRLDENGVLTALHTTGERVED